MNAANPEIAGREKSAKAGKAETLQQKLAILERQAEVVRQKLQEQKRKEREGNVRQIATLIQKEDLAEFSIDAWRAALPQIRDALGASATAQ